MEDLEEDYLEYDIMTRYPLLCASEDLTKWSGFISIENRATLISLIVPQFPTCKFIFLDTKVLDKKTVNYWNLILKEIAVTECRNFLDFLKQIEKKVLSEVDNVGGTPGEIADVALSSSEIFSVVIDEVEKIGVNNVVSMSPDFRELVIKYVDGSERQHLLKLSIPVKYPEAKPKVLAELPFPPESIQWPQRIQDIHKMFIKQVEKCSNFWDDMEMLDNAVKVVEPLQPSRSHYHRRILLEDNVIAHLIFNPVAPRALPMISFSGPEKLVENYNAAIDNECTMWDESIRVIQNLRSILDCEFVMKDSMDEGDAEEEPTPCTVCFVYSFDEEIPEIICECGAVFHKQCLQDLFVNDAGKQGMRRCVDCPNCQFEISVPQRLAVTSW